MKNIALMLLLLAFSIDVACAKKLRINNKQRNAILNAVMHTNEYKDIQQKQREPNHGRIDVYLDRVGAVDSTGKFWYGYLDYSNEKGKLVHHYRYKYSLEQKKIIDMN